MPAQCDNWFAMKGSWLYRLKNFLELRNLLLALLMVVCCPKAGQPVTLPSDELYHYQEVSGTITEEVEWHLTKSNFFRLAYISPTEQCITITDDDYNTRSWEMTSVDGENQLVAERKDRTITIRGNFKGEPINKVISIDDCPWYQATSLSLRGFIDSDDTECVFWTIRLTTLTAHKIKAIKKGVEQLGVNEDHLLRIRLTLPGLLAPLWKSDYWFDFPGGVFFRFQGPSGAPGSPMITITRMVD